MSDDHRVKWSGMLTMAEQDQADDGSVDPALRTARQALSRLLQAVGEYHRAPLADDGARFAALQRAYQLGRQAFGIPPGSLVAAPKNPFGELTPGIMHTFPADGGPDPLPTDCHVWRQQNEQRIGNIICMPDHAVDPAIELPATVLRLADVRVCLALWFRGVALGRSMGRTELAREFRALFNL